VLILACNSPVTKKYPSSRYWGVNAAVRYGDKTKNSTILKTTAGIVDTGTTLLGLATGKLLHSESLARQNIGTESYHLI
jgi:hypothetical protein